MCYYSGPRDSVYERLGHAEVVQLQLDPQRQHAELEKFADVRMCPFAWLQPLHCSSHVSPASAASRCTTQKGSTHGQDLLKHHVCTCVMLRRMHINVEGSCCAQVYFSQFRRTPFGMLRLDPQDAGPGYRNVIGIPGGVHSALFKLLQARMLPPSQATPFALPHGPEHAVHCAAPGMHMCCGWNSALLPCYVCEPY